MNKVTQFHERVSQQAGNLRLGGNATYASASGILVNVTETMVVDVTEFAKAWVWFRFTPEATATLQVRVYPISACDEDTLYVSTIAEESVDWTVGSATETVSHIELPQGLYRLTVKPITAGITRIHISADMFR